MKRHQLVLDNQRSKDWKIERLGNFTGSRIVELTKSGRKKDDVFGDTAKAYIYEVMAERNLSSKTIGIDEMWDEYERLTSSYSKAMEFGTNNEADALDTFEKYLKVMDSIEIAGVEYDPKDLEVIRTGSQPHPEIPNFAASPDSVIVDKNTGDVLAIVEVKVPLPKTYMKYVCEVNDYDTLKACNENYAWQMTAEAMVTGTSYGFFVTYCPFTISKIHVAPVAIPDDAKEFLTSRISLAEEFINTSR